MFPSFDLLSHLFDSKLVPNIFVIDLVGWVGTIGLRPKVGSSRLRSRSTGSPSAMVDVVTFLCLVGMNLHLFPLLPSLSFCLLASQSVLSLVMLTRDFLSASIFCRLWL